MDQRLTIVGLGVDNLAVSNHFYSEVLGWTKTSDSNERIAFYKLNGILLSLYSRENLAEDAHVAAAGIGFKGVTLAYNARSREEVDQIIDQLRAKDVRIIKEPQEVFWGGYSSYIADPDKHLWEIAFNPFLPMDEDRNVVIT
ncbi:MAG: VOC family protein [Saprospiraceae bacterium]|nr:VOC family protein [Saprospiraceae bacterium]